MKEHNCNYDHPGGLCNTVCLLCDNACYSKRFSYWDIGEGVRGWVCTFCNGASTEYTYKALRRLVKPENIGLRDYPQYDHEIDIDVSAFL